MGTPTVAVSTLVMAGSLVQVPTVAASAVTRGGRGDSNSDAALRAWRRFRVLVGFLHVVCRLVVVSLVMLWRSPLLTIPRIRVGL